MWTCMNEKTKESIGTISENVLAISSVRSFCAKAGFPMSTPDTDWLKEMPIGGQFKVGPITITRKEI